MCVFVYVGYIFGNFMQLKGNFPFPGAGASCVTEGDYFKNPQE